MADERDDTPGSGSDIAGTGGDGAGSHVEPADGGIRTVSPADGVVKRGRGRPRGSKNQGTPAASEGNEPNERRERPAQGTRKAQKATPHAVNATGGIERILYAIHTMGALIVPELEISEAESEKLTKALAGVNSFYASSIDPKMLAWVELAGVAGAIYGPRAMAFMVRRKMEVAEKQRPRVSPLAGVQPTQAAAPRVPQPTPAQAAQRVANVANGAPQNVRSMFADPSFVADVGDE
jgi:hypothetical protein